MGNDDQGGERRGPLARSFEELGEGMRRLRTSRGWSRQEVLARVDRVSKRDDVGWTLSAASLQRFEAGRGQRPRLAHANALDEAYEANQWIALSLAQLLGPAWQPWAEMDWPKNSHMIAWPAGLVSQVWVHVWPSSRSVGLEHSFALTWLGSAFRRRSVVLPPDGEYWVFMKPSVAGRLHADLEVVEASLPFHLLHGLGEPPREDVTHVQIGSEWVDTR